VWILMQDVFHVRPVRDLCGSEPQCVCEPRL
jgi:hypothetical protein